MKVKTATETKLLCRLFVCIIFIHTDAFAAYVRHQWQMGIGDPTILGWSAVLAYLVAAYLCLVCARECKKLNLPNTFWKVMTAFLLLLALNKQLDLQTLITQIGREFAFEHGLYQYRRKLQLAFVMLLLVTAVTLIAYLRLKMKKVWVEYRMVCVGLITLMAFIFIRIASFHHIDTLLKFHLFSVKLHQWLELAGLLVIILGAFGWLRHVRTHDIASARHLLD